VLAPIIGEYLKRLVNDANLKLTGTEEEQQQKKEVIFMKEERLDQLTRFLFFSRNVTC